MDNQHKKIKGYRDLTQDEIDYMNRIKQKGIELGDLIDELTVSNSDIDMRWLEIAKIDLQKGIMGLVRSVARPETF